MYFFKDNSLLIALQTIVLWNKKLLSHLELAKSLNGNTKSWGKTFWLFYDDK